MRQTIVIAPSNSLLLIMDRTAGIIPQSMNGRLVAATPSCIAVGTLAESEGCTSVTLTDDAMMAQPDLRLVIDTSIATPSKSLVVCSVLDEVLLETVVPSPRTRVQIWANDAAEPDILGIVIVP
jgi:hypothetical protein